MTARIPALRGTRIAWPVVMAPRDAFAVLAGMALFGCASGEDAVERPRPAEAAWPDAAQIGIGGTPSAWIDAASGPNAPAEAAAGTGGVVNGSDASGAGGGATNQPPPLDLKQVVWLHEDVSDWQETVTLSEVTFTTKHICFDHDIQDQNWPLDPSDPEAIANPWVFVWYEGQWYGATFEWLRTGPPVQECKYQWSVAGDHIKKAPFNQDPPFPGPHYWQPKSGDTLYFMVSGLARLGKSNVQERSNPLMVVWP